MVNQSNAKYIALRDSARHEGDLAQKCFAQSQNAYQAGDGARAHELSEQGKQHQARKRQIDGEARDWIFYQNNTDSSAGEVDLHGLYVKEAVEKAEQAIAERQRRGDRTVHFIVGKGNHSVGHVAKIRPAIEDLMYKYVFPPGCSLEGPKRKLRLTSR
jgi:DNA-nicking Smr family endonuclease